MVLWVTELPWASRGCPGPHRSALRAAHSSCPAVSARRGLRGSGAPRLRKDRCGWWPSLVAQPRGAYIPSWSPLGWQSPHAAIIQRGNQGPDGDLRGEATVANSRGSQSARLVGTGLGADMVGDFGQIPENFWANFSGSPDGNNLHFLLYL